MPIGKDYRLTIGAGREELPPAEDREGATFADSRGAPIPCKRQNTMGVMAVVTLPYAESLRLPATLAAPGLARRRVVLACDGLDDDARSTAGAGHELVANAVLHPDGGGRPRPRDWAAHPAHGPAAPGRGARPRPDPSPSSELALQPP